MPTGWKLPEWLGWFAFLLDSGECAWGSKEAEGFGGQPAEVSCSQLVPDQHPPSRSRRRKEVSWCPPRNDVTGSADGGAGRSLQGKPSHFYFRCFSAVQKVYLRLTEHPSPGSLPDSGSGQQGGRVRGPMCTGGAQLLSHQHHFAGCMSAGIPRQSWELSPSLWGPGSLVV